MTQQLKYFSLREFKCRCGRKECDAVPVEEELLRLLEFLRHDWGHPLIVTSGVRCSFWNDKVGGALKSQHVLGKAADLKIKNRNEGKALMALAKRVGFRGIGLAENFLHVDIRDGAPRFWEYPPRG